MNVATADQTVVAPIAKRANRWKASTRSFPTASEISFILRWRLAVDEDNVRVASGIGYSLDRGSPRRWGLLSYATMIPLPGIVLVLLSLV
jgi:hypothetical protein